MPTDNTDRDKLYSANPVDDEDDGELELEPLDPAVIAAEKQRAAAAIEVHRSAIDIDEVFRDFDANRDSEIVKDWVGRFKGLRFQFQVKHLLVLTAVVAIVLAVRNAFHMGFGTMLIVAFMLAVAGITLALKLEENKRQEEADRRRQKMYAQRRAQQAKQAGQNIEVEEEEEPEASSLHAEPGELAPAPNFRFQFSLSQLLATITAAAMLLGFVSLLGGPSNAATLCGLVALAGLIIPALGYELPAVVVFGWWILLVMYVALSLFAAIWAGLAGA